MPIRPPDLPPPIPTPANMDVFKEFLRAMRQVGRHSPVAGKYLHWDDLRHRTPPVGLTAKQWWWTIRQARHGSARPLPALLDREGQAFSFVMTEQLERTLHLIDQKAAGTIQMGAPIATSEERDRYVVRSLIEEALTSSQLEGAATTREVAKEMIRTGRRPITRDERMVVNNYQTMRHIVEHRNRSLTPDLLLELHRLVTDGALDKPSAAGRTRQNDEHVVVEDDYGQVLHDPPIADELNQRLQALCDFANAPDDSTPFVHPVLRAMIAHFMLAYIHPFVDGNGRTARAIFYWCMLRRGYWLCEFLSISRVILRAPKQYGRAFLLTESDEGDLTYFLLYHVHVLEQAIEALHVYLDEKSRQLNDADTLLRSGQPFNHRQRALLSHALRHPGYVYTARSHATSHNVVLATARADLLELASANLLVTGKRIRSVTFTSPADLSTRLQQVD